MFAGHVNHRDSLLRANSLAVVLHEAAEAAFSFQGGNRHFFHRLFLVVQGDGASSIRSCPAGRRLTMRTGCGYFMPAGLELAFEFTPKTYFISFHFNVRYGNLQELFAEPGECAVLENCAPEIERTRTALLQAPADWDAAFRLNALVNEWIARIAERHAFRNAVANNGSEEKYADLLLFLEQKADAGSTLEDFAQISGMSADTLSRQFSRDFGIPLKRCAMRNLVARAEQCLRNDELKIRDVARLLHFSDEYYFSRFFKKETGCSPKEFRRLLRGNPAPEC